MRTFELSQVGLIRIFKLADHVNQNDNLDEPLLNTLAYLYHQCNALEKAKMQELFPKLIEFIENKTQ